MKVLYLFLILISTSVLAQREIRYEGGCYLSLVDSNSVKIDSCFSTCGKFVVSTTRIEHIDTKSSIYEIQQREWVTSCICLYYYVYPKDDEFQQFVIRIDEKGGMIDVAGFVGERFVIINYHLKVYP